ncbi:MAG TPA: dienelactone hydrolase family protein [Candidatus Lustribacter sp.]|nr:dienelactone hydrolase family protein [Candidatus Lustribacter sp.]
MPIVAKDITIPVAGGTMPAFLTLPETRPAPALVIVPSVFGVGAVARETGKTFAEHGFITLTLDVFFRTIPGPLNMADKAEFAKALERNERFDAETGQRDMAAARDFALALPECNGKWALLGYCFGGRYALRAGAYMGADAVAAFHPSKMGVELEAAAAVTCPTSFHFGGADQQVPPSEIEAVQRALAGNPRAESYVYPGIGHGFTSPGGPAYDAGVAKQSFERALRVLDELKTPAVV